MNRIVLASTSPWRRRMLADVGIEASAEAPGVDERAVVAEGPVALARTLALAKARAVSQRHPEAWTIGADQVVHQDGEVFGKPIDAEDQRRRLRSLRGRSHELVTGWAVVGPDGEAVGHRVTRMHVRADVDDAEIDAYVACGEGAGCAGGYAAEGRGAFLFERADGDWFTVIGLPVFDVLGELRRRGWRFR